MLDYEPGCTQNYKNRNSIFALFLFLNCYALYDDTPSPETENLFWIDARFSNLYNYSNPIELDRLVSVSKFSSNFLSLIPYNRSELFFKC